MKPTVSKKGFRNVSLDGTSLAAKRWLHTLPSRLLLRHGRLLQSLVLLLGLIVAIAVAAWLLFTAPGLPTDVRKAESATLQTEKLEAITSLMEVRLRSRETGLVIPQRAVFDQTKE